MNEIGTTLADLQPILPYLLGATVFSPGGSTDTASSRRQEANDCDGALEEPVPRTVWRL